MRYTDLFDIYFFYTLFTCKVLLSSMYSILIFIYCAAQNNADTRHLAKILIHLSWCLQECVSISDASTDVYEKAVNAVYISSVFLKYLIENAKSDNLEELYLSLDEKEPIPKDFVQGN
jgi:hypothetical protein